MLCRSDECPGLILRLRASLYNAKVEYICDCGQAECATYGFVAQCDCKKFERSLNLSAPNLDALGIIFCERHGVIIGAEYLRSGSAATHS